MKMYIKSISGQVYCVNEMPKYSAGYEMVGRAEFEAWCAENGFTPEEMGG